jgi:hypothetical protein
MKFSRSLVLSLLAIALVATPAAAATSLTWSSAKALVLPSGTVGVYSGIFDLLNCPSAGNCVAVGTMTTAAGSVSGVAYTETKGTWGSATALTNASDAGTNPGVTIDGLSCATTASCVATGSYLDTNGSVQAFYQEENAGTWASAVKVALPSNAVATGQNALLRSVSCPSAGNCAAIGTYLDNSTPIAKVVPFTLNEVKGVWSKATPLTLPASANANSYATTNQVACTSAGNCVAIGSFATTGGATEGLVASEVNGTWGNAQVMATPANAGSYPNVVLSEITCVSNYCSATGTYTTNSGATSMLVVTNVGGQWLRANSLRLPSNAATNPKVALYGFQGIACVSAGNCVTGGQYRDSAGNYQGFLVNEVKGVWQTATAMGLPTGTTQAGANGGVVTLSCRSVGNCAAGASYLDASGAYQAGVVNEVNGVWQPVTHVTLPTGAVTVGQGGGIYTISCHTTGGCDAIGSYESASGTYPPFALSAK